MIAGIFSVLSFVMIGWVANDAARHYRSWFGWAFLVANTSVLGLIVWWNVRRRSAAPERRLGSGQRALLWLAAIPVFGVNLLITALIVTFLFQSARVDGEAMAPTLNSHDHVIVNKLVYWVASPQRGDVVMHRYPLNPQKSFVMRVIAREGDTVRIVDGRVYVNDVALQDEYVTAEFRSHDDWGPEVIRRGYFVMGDHRNNSADSRQWGVVPANDIMGKVQARWRPFTAATIF